MNSVIESRVRVDALGVFVFRDPRMTPGEEVEIVVRPITPRNEAVYFLSTARRVRVDEPSDFSETFDEPSKFKP